MLPATWSSIGEDEHFYICKIFDLRDYYSLKEFLRAQINAWSHGFDFEFFARFPVDEQYCQIKFESFGFTNKQVSNLLTWNKLRV